jgi:ABC-type transport system involved in cytochrome c biogenesis permease subunit
VTAATTLVMALQGTGLALLVVAIPLAGPGASGARRRLVVAALGGAALLHLAGLAAWWAHVGHGPYLDRFEVLSSNAWTQLAVFLVAAWRAPALRDRARPVLLVVAAQLALGLWIGPGVKTLPPVMDSGWLTAHAIAYKVSLAAAVVALALALPMLRGQSAVTSADAAPVAAPVDDAQHRWTGQAFVFWTAGMLLGSVWGYHAFGRFWGWDAVELWALAGWAALGTYLHLLRFFRLPARLRAGLYLATFTTLLVALYLAPLARAGLHAGSFVK